MDGYAHVGLAQVSKVFGANPRRSVTAVDDVTLAFESGGSAIGIVGGVGVQNSWCATNAERGLIM